MKLYSTLSRKLEDLPLGESEIKMYVCGITPYAPCHVGHAMSYVIFDVLRRYLEVKGHDVLHIQNFTDIDDKIINRAAQEGITTSDLANLYIQEYTVSMDRLNVKRASAYPLATESIPKILEVIQGLIDTSYAYASNGDVYFRVGNDEDYGKLSHRTLENMVAGARVEILEGKENPMDFALWKAAKPGEPAWDSPWGSGRPGWHIEDTAITLKHLGTNYCIHGGAVELAFPHHEAEIAQAESVTGVKPLAKYWMHTGLLMIKEQKMSKSLKNYISIKNILDKYDSSTLKLFFASSHYRSPIDFKQEYLGKTQKNLSNIINTYSRLKDLDESKTKNEFETKILKNITTSKRKFFAAMDDDINTPIAISRFLEIIHQVNVYCETNLVITHKTKNNIMCFIQDLGNILGLNILELYSQTKGSSSLTAEQIEKEIEKRNQYRKNKKWEEADLIRQNLESIGIILEDVKTANGDTKTQWKIKK